MRRVKVVLVAALAIPLAGCLLSGKPKTVAAPAPPQPAAPAAPPEPLSIPQTHVDLPAPQTVVPEALATAPPEQPAPQVQVKPAAPPPKPAQSPVQQPKPVDQPPPEPLRPPIQEILPAEVENTLKKQLQEHKEGTEALLAGAGRRNLNGNERRMEALIKQFLTQSAQAETTGDLRSADRLAERAYILAKELQSGK